MLRDAVRFVTAECRYAECDCAECRHAEFDCTECRFAVLLC